ncbi:CvpA family protein [Rickettsiales bacterium]|nr:CvpA family protein [Rickettsiales bacterium]
MDSLLSGLNWFDVIILSIISISTIFAFLRGFLKAIFSFSVWILSTVAAYYLYPYIVDFIGEFSSGEETLIGICMLVVFIIIFIIISLIFSKILSFLVAHRKTWMDRTLGFAFGLVRGVIIACMIFFSIQMTVSMLNAGGSAKNPSWLTQAKTYRLLEITTDFIINNLPEGSSEEIDEAMNRFKNISEDVVKQSLGMDVSQRTLSSEDRAIIGEVIKSLPKRDLNFVYDKLKGGMSDASNEEKVKVFSKILDLYKAAFDKGEIQTPVDSDKIKHLDEVLNGNGSASDEIGYQKNNIKQLERLVDQHN